MARSDQYDAQQATRARSSASGELTSGSESSCPAKDARAESSPIAELRTMRGARSPVAARSVWRASRTGAGTGAARARARIRRAAARSPSGAGSRVSARDAISALEPLASSQASKLDRRRTNPDGTGSPSRIIRPRVAAFPPTSLASSASASGQA